MSSNEEQSSSTDITNAGVDPLQSATVLMALEASDMAYGTYTASGVIDDSSRPNVAGEDPTNDGWKEITGLSTEDNSADHYQGAAFYKVVDGITEIVIANRGSQVGGHLLGLQDYLGSDALLAFNGVPHADQDALSYYNSVVAWAQSQNFADPVNILETGHSLGGQEADFVEVETTTNANTVYDTQAVTFNAPGMATSVLNPAFNYDALNVTLSNDFVHVGGGILNAGYAGTEVTIKGGVPITGFEETAVAGLLADNPLVFLGGLAPLAYFGLYANHVVDPLYAYFKEHPALGGVDLLQYYPAQVTQAAVDAMATTSAEYYATVDTSPGELAKYYQAVLGTPAGPGSGSTSAPPAGNQGSDSGSMETYTESETGNTVVLTGSDGNFVTFVASSGATQVTDSAGGSDILTMNAAGTEVTSDSWTTASGTKGQDFYQANGWVAGDIVYANGGYATYFSDGQGNLTTDYYTTAGVLYSWSAVHADGTSVTGTELSDGLTILPDSAPSHLDVPNAIYQVTVNPNGSSIDESWNPADQYSVTNYDASGNVVSSSSGGQGSGQDYDQSNLTQTTHTDSSGETTIQARDASGKLVWESWTDPDGSGKITYHASGTVVEKDLNSDGTGELTFSDVGELTHNFFDNNQNLTSDTWQLADGTTGQDQFNDDGSGSGTFKNTNGSSSSTVTVDPSLDITIKNENANGVLVSEDWWDRDGTHGIIMFNPDNSHSTYTYLATGQVQETQYASNGGVESQQTESGGGIISPDGSEFGKIANPDGSYSIDFTDSSGDSLTFNASAAGALQSMDHSEALQASNFVIQTQSGPSAQSPYNPYTPVTTSADGTQTTSYLNGSGRVTGDDWSNATQNTRGYDTFNADGSSNGTYFYADGSSYTYTNDGAGNLVTNYYDSNGNLTSDAWQDADGSHGTDQYNMDGSSAGMSYDASGNYSVYSDDGNGTLNEGDYSSAGVLLSDSWQKPDGTFGYDTYSADGSSTNTKYNADGSYQVETTDTQGKSTISQYSDIGVLTSDVWKKSDGTQGDDTFSSDGSSIGETLSSTGSILSDYNNDGKGDETTYSYNSAGALTGDTWTNANGSTGTDSLGPNGTSSGSVHYADGSTSSYTTDSQGDATGSTYSSSGVLLSTSWRDANGTAGSDTYGANGAITGTTSDTSDGSSSVYVNDGQGDVSTTNYDSNGRKIGDTWQKSDGTHGSDQLTDGTWTHLSYAADGSYSKTTQDQAAGDTTAAQYSSAGVLTSNQWSNVDGTHGSTTYATDGSSVATSYNRDGSYQTTTADAGGDSETDYYSSSGQLIRDTWHHADGTSGSDAPNAPANSDADYQKDGVYAVASNGNFNFYNASGSLLFSMQAYENIQLIPTGGGYGGGYGDGYGGNTPMQESVTQVTANQSATGPDGETEKLTESLQPWISTSAATETLANGKSFDSLWDEVHPVGTPTSSTVSYDVQAAGGGGILAAGGGSSDGGGGVVNLPPGGGWAFPTADIASIFDVGSVTYITTIFGTEYIYSRANNGTITEYLGGGGGSLAYVKDLQQAVNYSLGMMTGTYTWANGTSETYTTGPGGYINYYKYLDGTGGVETFSASNTAQVTNDINAAGYTSKAIVANDDNERDKWYADGRVAEVDILGGSQSTSDVIHDPYGYTISTIGTPTFVNGFAGPTASAQEVLVDSNGDTITSNFNVGWNQNNYMGLATYTEQSTWQTADGTQVTAAFDLVTDIGTITMDYADGTSSVVTTDGNGGYRDNNYNANGVLTDDQWKDIAGDHGSGTYNADGSGTETDYMANGDVKTTIYAAGMVATSASATNPDGTTQTETFNSLGQETGWSETNPDGSAQTKTFDGQGHEMAWSETNPDGSSEAETFDGNGHVTSWSYTDTDGTTQVTTFDNQGQEATWSQTTASGMKQTETFSQGQLVSQYVTRPDGSTEYDTYATSSDGQLLLTGSSKTNADGSTSQYTVTYAPDGSYTSTYSSTSTDGSSRTDTADYDTQGRLTFDHTTTSYGSIDDTTFTYNSDGTSSDAESYTPPGGAAVLSTALFDADGNYLAYNSTYPDGTTDDTSYTNNADGSGSSTEVITPGDGRGATTIAMQWDSSGYNTGMVTDNPDGSITNTTYAYNDDGSHVETAVETPVGRGATTTAVLDYNPNWNLTDQHETNADGSANDTSFSYSDDGSYTATEQYTLADGSSGGSGSYWWNASTSEYQATWQNSNGTSWTDDYQFSSGGDPWSEGSLSFTETYSDSAGDVGTRHYDAATGAASVSWYSSATGETTTGTTTDAGFFGVTNDGELTNSQTDPSFFNPTVSPAFHAFLTGH
jgi:hypothetical protein